MSRTLQTLFAKLARNRDAPLAVLAKKAGRLLRESASAAVFLRDCDHVGAHPRVDGVLRVRNEGRIELGNDVRLISRWAPILLSTRRGGTITIGSGSSINYGTLVSAAKRVTIGKRVMIGNYCVIADTRVPGLVHDETDEHDENAGGNGDVDDAPAAVEIGDGAWLAVRVTVLPGAKIGAGAVITAGSVVEGEIPPGVLAGGVPARVLRTSVLPPAPVASIAPHLDAAETAHPARAGGLR